MGLEITVVFCFFLYPSPVCSRMRCIRNAASTSIRPVLLAGTAPAVGATSKSTYTAR